MPPRKAAGTPRTRRAGRNGPPELARAKKPAAPATERQLEIFRGVLQDFNFGPTGGVEGFILHSEGQSVQVNVRPEVGFAVVRGIGQSVEATVEPEKTRSRRASYPIYRLVSLAGADGKPLIFAEPGDKTVATVQGTLQRINYSRTGEPTGVILDSGDLIHLTPAGLKKAALKVGDQVTAEGPASLMPLGHKLIEATSVNGTDVTRRRRGPGRPRRK
jgi:hypothetical protein